jgi:hypothetical protein
MMFISGHVKIKAKSETSMKTILIGLVLASSALAVSTPPASAAGGEAIVSEYARKAIERGYGGMCSLGMEPVKSGGYYPCLDFGPYRFVVGYESVSAYVVQKGSTPFQVMGGSPARFLVDGPWTTDMPERAVSYWNDTVMGGAARLKEVEDGVSRKSAAAAYIDGLNKKEEPPAPKPLPRTAVPPQTQPSSGGLSDRGNVGQPVDGADLKSVLKQIGAPEGN